MLSAILVGAGGHAKSVIDASISNGIKIIGVIDRDPLRKNSKFGAYTVLGDDNSLNAYPPESFALINGLGTTKCKTGDRKELFLRLKGLGYQFITVIHKSAYVASTAVLGEGTIVLAGAIIQPDTTIGENTIINTRATIEHDSRIGAHCHIAPGAIVCGNVSIGSSTFVGAASCVIENLTVGENVIVAAGATVVSSVEKFKAVKGTPAQ